MSSHHVASHFGGSHYESSHYGRAAAEVILEFLFGAGDDQGQIEDELILAIIKAFIQRVS